MNHAQIRDIVRRGAMGDHSIFYDSGSWERLYQQRLIRRSEIRRRKGGTPSLICRKNMWMYR